MCFDVIFPLFFHGCLSCFKLGFRLMTDKGISKFSFSSKAVGAI